MIAKCMMKIYGSVTLCLNEQEIIENRVAKIVEYLANVYPNAQWIISDIEQRVNGAIA